MSASIRTSASLLVISPSNHILFMLRPKKGTFPQTHVFPGGKLEESDPSLAYCALRETYEETGLLISPDSLAPPVVHPRQEVADYRQAVTKITGNDPLKHDWNADGGLARFTEWTTPAKLADKRFMTQFFVYFAPKQFQLGPVEPNSEVVALEWLTPAQALADFQSARVALMPPQFYLLTSIHEQGALGAIKKVGSRKFTPKIIGKRPDGRIEMDWGHGEAGLMTYDKAGVIRNIEYIRAKL